MRTIHDAPAGLRAGLSPRTLAFELSFMLTLAVVLTATGTFGIFLSGGWPERLAYWIRTVLAGYLIHRPLLRVCAGAAVKLALPEPAGWAASVLIGSAPMALWLWWLGPKIDLDRPWPDAGAFASTWAQAAVIAALGFGAMWVIAGRWTAGGPARDLALAPAGDPGPSGARSESSAADARPGQRLLERLPPRLGGEVIALGMEDHYVRVFTPLGDALVLMRMADAVTELATVEGLQVHRSWWVARSAVATVERRGRTGFLQLENGLEVPIARRRLDELRRRGWIGAG